MRFLIVGNGQPAAAAIEAARSRPEIELAAFLTSDADRNRVEGAPTLPEATIRDRAALEAAGLLDVDWLLVANSTTIVPRSVLGALRGRALNFHPGLLPEYAGLHTHQWAIREGAEEFGVTLHYVEPAVDTGDIVAETRFALKPEDTGVSVYLRCMKLGAALLTETIGRIAEHGPPVGRAQDLSKRRLFRHADALEDRVDWTRPAEEVRNFIRAGSYAPFESPTYTARIHAFGAPPIAILKSKLIDAAAGAAPGTVVEVADQGPVIACGEGALMLTRATRDGAPLDAAAWRALLAARGSQILSDDA